MVFSEGPEANFFVLENQEDNEDEEEEGDSQEEVGGPLNGGTQEDLLIFWWLVWALTATMSLNWRAAHALATTQ